ncbi:hypothetical protein HMN09_00649400 [Mycena chlorophos]|uniref:Uncharacterized protein n=1 Tax=Mycena chlorophos TaxID=658473 RepID=A0A8H6WDQ7_MYCCL|nr:hypothetical protein HMN09_00649400 [Mycena chlorophos]
MSTALSSQSPRSWWQKSSPTGDSFDKKTPGKFNTLASAIGLRPKKSHPPPLAIRGELPVPQPLRRPYTAPSSPGGIGRPASNSVSSNADSLELNSPKTPDDRRGSLMTLSDTDPFAAPRVVSVHSPSDAGHPNRLSAFSSSSDIKSLAMDGLQRVSYASASSSTQSFRLGSELSPLSPISDGGSPILLPVERKLSNASGVRRKDLAVDINRFSQPDPPPKPRPAMRARGLTDSLDRAPFLRNDSFSSQRSLASPVSPSRKISQRTAPPTSELPSPPGSSSTSLTFPEVKPLVPRKPKASPESSSWDVDPQPPRVPRMLKKSMSQQSLNKQRSPSISTVPMPDSAPGPRKQRSFHRLPVYAVPLQLPLTEQRAEPSQRKRMFSTSSGRRPSQSTLPLVDDAAESDRVTLSASTSYWIDADQPRTPTSEYMPQQIMSPAEMLAVEARVEAEYHSRPRGGSIMSASEFDHDSTLSPARSFGGGRKRSNSDHPSLRSPAEDYYEPEPPSPPVLMSLPPPPRRTKSRTSSISSRTTLEVRTSVAVSPQQTESFSPLSPPPRKTVRPKKSMDKQQRHMLMRKPSFLDIDDEIDRTPAPPVPPPVILNEDSFLDLTRESFDSTRSDDDSF